MFCRWQFQPLDTSRRRPRTYQVDFAVNTKSSSLITLYHSSSKSGRAKAGKDEGFSLTDVIHRSELRLCRDADPAHKFEVALNFYFYFTKVLSYS